MGGPTSQNAPTCRPGTGAVPIRRIVVSLAGATAFLITAWLAFDYVAGSELGRTIDANLTWLADPRTWLR